MRLQKNPAQMAGFFSLDLRFKINVRIFAVFVWRDNLCNREACRRKVGTEVRLFRIRNQNISSFL